MKLKKIIVQELKIMHKMNPLIYLLKYFFAVLEMNLAFAIFYHDKNNNHKNINQVQRLFLYPVA